MERPRTVFASFATAVLLVSVPFALSLPALAEDGDESPSPSASRPPPTRSQGQGGDDRDADENGRDPERRGGDDGGRGSDDKDDDDDDDRGREGTSKPRRASEFSELDGRFAGRYVSFQWDEGSCSILDYRVHNFTWFASIALGPGCDEGAWEAMDEGAKVEFESGDASIRIRDTPNGHFRLRTHDEGAPVMTLAPGLDATFDDDALRLVSGNYSARIWANGDGSLGWSAPQTLTLEDGSANFLVHPREGLSQEHERLREAKHSGQVGGEIDVLPGGNVQSGAFDDVAITRQDSGEAGSYRFLIDANLTEGRVFVVNLAPGALKSGDVGLRYYDVDAQGGYVEVAINESDSLEDNLLIEPGEGPEYWIVKDGAGVHVMIAAPHFSPHIFDIYSIPAYIVPIIVYGLIFGVAFVGFATFGLFVRRRDDI